MNANFIIRNKKAILSMTLILLLTTTLMMAFAQPTSGQAGVPQPEKTVGYATVAPTLIGVGQQLTVNLWVFPLPTAYDYASYFNGFYGITVTFVRPDGTKDTFTPTDGTGVYAPGQMQALGALFFTNWAPSMAGNWSVSFTMPAQNITTSAGTVQYSGCTSNTFYFTVQTDQVLAGLLNGYPWSQLPNSNVYWSYPIDTNNREWYQISGDWTGISSTMATVNSPTQLRWQPYGPGANTAHIVWDDPIKEGGMIGGSYSTLSYYANPTTVVVMDGKAFYNIPNTTPAGQAFGQFRCVDEATGKVLYQVNGSITCGIHMPNLLGAYQQSATSVAYGETIVVLPNSYGAYQYPYLYGTATVNGITYWNYYDPLTGVLVKQINNCSTSRLIDGTLLAFGAANSTIVGAGIKGTTGYLYRWNMTSVATTGTNANQWVTGITWKVPLPTTLYGGVPALFAVSSDGTTVMVGTKNQYWGFSATNGASLWNLTLNYPITSNEEIPLANVDDFFVFDSVAATFKFYSIKTGAFLFETPSFASSPWASTYTVYNSETNDLNNVYFAFPDGAMRAYSLTDGHLIWTSAPFASTEYANNAVPYAYAGVVMEGGLIYGYAGYSTLYQIDPLPRFNMLVCYNATTGDTVFALNGGIDTSAAANGYVIGNSINDGNMYCVGKGQTSTTVSAPQTAITAGTSVLISGTVMDQSAAQPNTPAISDANMSEWMDYLHMQNSTLLNSPPNCIGVPVSLTAVDPNGNAINIGTVTSLGSGNFGYQWTPTTAGLYQIYATFAGSNSYFSSYAQTFATVNTPASTPTSSPAPTSTASSLVSNSDMLTYLVIVAIAIIIAIAIVGALILRKK